jgi:hypothetical protein
MLNAGDYDSFRIERETIRGDIVDRVAFFVVGTMTNYWGETTEDILVDDLNSQEFAEAWLRVYLESYVKDTYFNGPRDC